MNVTEHLSHLDDAGQRLSAAAAAAGPDAPVPSCPDWVVRDLVMHQGGIHRWATSFVRERRTEFWGIDLGDVVGSWPSDADLLDWFAAGHADLIGAIRAADPDLVCWTFLPAPSPLAMWARRQAHETTVHRVDAELAAGWPLAKIPAAFAADGVDELLRCFITRRGGSLRADPARTLRVSCTDGSGDWLVSVQPDRVVTSAGDDGPADCHVRGTASDLYLALWHRLPLASVSVEGDANVFDLFNEQVKVTWG